MANKRLASWASPGPWQALADGDVIVDANGTVIPFPASNIQAAMLGYYPQGRLSNVIHEPLGGTTLQSTVYYIPYTGNHMVLWDGSKLTRISFVETSLALGTLPAFQAYDVFGYLSSGVLALEELEWANSTVTMTIASPGVITWTGHQLHAGSSLTLTTTGALPTGLTANTQYFVGSISGNTFKLATTLANMDAGTFINTSGSQSGTHTAHSPTYRNTSLSIQNGMWCKTGDATRLYLGSFMTDSTTTTSSSLLDRLVMNFYNRVPLPVQIGNGGATSWNYTTATYRQINANVNARIAVLSCDPSAGSTYGDNSVSLTAKGIASNSVGSTAVALGVGIDTTITNSCQIYGDQTQSTFSSPITSWYNGGLTLGYHQLCALEIATASGTTTWKGTGGFAFVLTGLSGFVMG